MDPVFKALADNSRRELIKRLHIQNGQTLRALSVDLSMTRQAVTKHLAILEEAGIVTTDWRGREKFHFLNTAPLLDTAAGWLKQFGHTHPQPPVPSSRPPSKSASSRPTPAEIDGESRWTNL